MTTFGQHPGVKVTTTGGSVTGVSVGRETNLIIVGNGDSSAGSASVNTATQISSPGGADTQFGSDTELADAMRNALDNGANIDHLYGVMLDEVSVTDESISQSDTLNNAPIIEDTSLITLEDSGSTNPSVEFRYDSPPPTPSGTDEAFINPSSGEIEADATATGSYTIDYTYPDWSAALTEAESVVGVEETGVIAVLDEAESVASDLVTSIDDLRSDYKMAVGLAGAEHNANTSDNDASVDASAYTDSVDDDSMFLSGPVRLADSKKTVLGAMGGLMAGNSLTNSIYNDELVRLGDDLEEQYTSTDVSDLAGEQVIPIQQTQTGGPIHVTRNLSTSTASGWTRDYYSRRIVDEVVLIAKTVGDTLLGRINSQENREATADAISAEIRDLVRRDLLKPNTVDSQRWEVSVYDTDTANEVGIDLAITPTGVTKQIDATVTINTA